MSQSQPTERLIIYGHGYIPLEV